MPTGKVKFFNADKGFGFVSNDEGDDVYVHRDALPDGMTELKPGQRVEYGVVTGRKGNQAMQVRVLDPAAVGRRGPPASRPRRWPRSSRT